MGIINSKKNGLYAFIQPVKAPDGSVQVASALAPQQLLITQNVAYLNNSPIDTTGSIHPLSFQSPDFNGLMSGTKNGVARAATGYSRTMMVKGKPVVTNSTKKIINYGNCPSSPMVAATNSKTYAYIADYHYGLDYFSENIAITFDKIEAFVSTLEMMKIKGNINSVLLKVFFDAKNGEIIQYVSNYSEKEKLLQKLAKIDPPHSAKYNEALD